MGKGGHSEDEILRVLREAESGTRSWNSAASMGLVSRRFIAGRRSMRELRQLRGRTRS
jgi:hypothetical protein